MWISEKICLDTEKYFELVCQAIATARHSVLLEMYIFRNDQLGNRVLAALRSAAERGVSVRVVVDGVGSPQFNRRFLQKLQRHQIAARVFHPTPGDLRSWRFLSPVRFLSIVSAINKRNHRKLVVVDRAFAFVGSCNIADMHRNWRETAVRVSGAGIEDLTRSFELVWSRSSNPDTAQTARLRAGPMLKSDAGSPVYVNYTRRRRRRHNAEIAGHIALARTRVWITTAYFVPSPMIVSALIRATRNGCDVKLLLPGKNDVTMVSCVSRMFYLGLMRAGVKIYEYQPTMLHAKTLLIDDWACVGTSNLNHRSFYHDLEVDLSLQRPSSRLKLAEQFRQDLLVSRQMTAEWLSRRSILEKIGGYLVYPFRNFI